MTMTQTSTAHSPATQALAHATTPPLPVPMPVPARVINEIMNAALAEDNPRGDLTGNVLIPADARATAWSSWRSPRVSASARARSARRSRACASST